MSTGHETRAIDISVELDAPPDAVWKALTEAAELESWFPVEARVEPGAGGSIWVSWGTPETGWASRISVWDPPRHLQLSDPPAPDAPVPPVPIVLDYYLEGAGGRTVLRLVHSGFSASADWDEMFDNLDGGWRYFLLNLDHYLTRHRGTHRRMAWTRTRVEDRTRQELWPLVMKRLGLGADPRPGDAASIRVGPETHVGSLLVNRPPTHIAMTLPDLEDGLFFMELECGGPPWHLGIWFSTYGVSEDRVKDLQRTLDEATADLIAPTR